VNGEEPGPVPVNEEGEAMSGYANGGDVKVGFANNGRFYVDTAGNVTTRAPSFRAGVRDFLHPINLDPRYSKHIDPRGMAQTAADAARRVVAGPAVQRGAQLVGKTGNVVLPLVEGAQTAAVAADPNMTGLDTATQAASGLGRLATAGLGAAYGGATFGPPGAVVGGIGGYIAGDQLIQLGRRLAGTDPNDPFDRLSQETPPEPEATPEGPDPYRRAFTNTEAGLRHPDTLYSAAMPVPEDWGPRIVQRTGGPGDEVIAREDIDGVPTFTNLRRTGFDGSAANLQREADIRAAEDAVNREQLLTNLARERELFDSATSANALDRQAEVAAARGGSGNDDHTKFIDERIRQRFLMPQFDDDGNITDYVKDEQKTRAFDDAMTALGVDITGMSRAQQNQIFEDFDSVYRDTMIAMREARARGLPISDIPRTGAHSLRAVPDREILLGDVFDDDATLSDWWAGLGNDDPVLNNYIHDPLSGANIPARRVVGDNGLRLDDLVRYGLLKGEK
jgi:hypothetical protein